MGYYKIDSRDCHQCPYIGDRRGEYCFYKGRFNPGCDGLMWLKEAEGMYYCITELPVNVIQLGTPSDIKILNLIKSVVNRKGLGDLIKKYLRSDRNEA